MTPWKGKETAKTSQDDNMGVSQNHSQVAGRKKKNTQKTWLASISMDLPKLTKLVGTAGAIWGSLTRP